GDAGVETLANSPRLTGLTELFLGYNQIGDAGAEALANSPYLVNLTSLWMYDNPMIRDSDEAVLLLEERFGDGFECN
ncbi:MAG: leucine-rich repeat domain-containing protein, partial [Planctomycetales bacterium]